MKSVQKITRIQLDLPGDSEYILFGLVSSEPDYKLSQIINRKFRISLKNTAPIKSFDETGIELSFSRFTHTNDSTGVSINLISNRAGNNFLLRKLKNVDFIFQLHDPENEKDIDEITSSLRETESVNAVFSIDLNTFKDKNIQYLTQ
jgi:hypothetical protein